jgi:hypothetical protein
MGMGLGQYRRLADRTVQYVGAIRDYTIDTEGIVTKIRRPAVENQMDYYGNYVPDYQPEEDIAIVPQYNKYYQVIDVLGYCVEPELPLEALVKRYDYIPNDSIIKIAVRNLAGGLQERWWRVLSTEVKHLENVYARTAKLSPVREVIAQQSSCSIIAHSFVTMDNDP